MLCSAPPTGVPGLLFIATATWRLDLAVWEYIGVREPKQLAINNYRTVVVNWLNPDRLAIVLALQHKLPGQLSTAEVIERFAAAGIIHYSAKRIIGRLLYLQHKGLTLHHSKAGKPNSEQRITPDNLARSTHATFLGLVAAAREPSPNWKPAPAAFKEESEQFEHFVATITPQLPEYKEIIKRSQAWACEIAAHLDPALLEEAAKARGSGKHVKKALGGY